MDETDHSSKRPRVTETSAEAEEASLGHNKKYIPDWEVFDHHSVFDDKNNEVAIELMLGAVLPADRVYVNSLQPEDASSHLMQSIAQMPVLVDKLTQVCLESQRNLKSLEAALKLEKVERKRWEQQFKELYYELHNTEGIEADQVIMKVKKDESSIEIELERKLDEKQRYIGALEERLTTMMNVKDRDDIAYNQRIRELSEQLLSLEKRSEAENYLIKMGLELKLDEKQKIIEELEERLKITKAPIKIELEKMGSNESLDERLKAMRDQKKKDDLAFNQRIRELNEQLLSLQKRSEAENYLIKMGLEVKLDEKQKIITELEERLKTTKPPIKMELETMGSNESLDERLKEMTNQKKKDDLDFNQRIMELRDQVHALETLNQTLIVKERQSNDMLQEARKALIEGMSDSNSEAKVHIGIKMMGKLDANAFIRPGNKKRIPDKYELKWCALWQRKLNNPEWHPFQVVVDDAGNSQVFLKEDDNTLNVLKRSWSNEVYNAVMTALKELMEYNPSGRFPVPELWNYKEHRKATLQEVIHFKFTQKKSPTVSS